MFIRVDLPEPEAPMMATISPRSMTRSMSSSTAMVSSPAGNSRRSPRSSSNGVPISEPHARAAATHHGAGARGGIAEDDLLAQFQAFEHLHVDRILQADADASRLDAAVRLQYLHRIEAVAAGAPQRRGRDARHIPRAVQHDAHLGGHGDAQLAVLVGHVERAQVVDGAVGTAGGAAGSAVAGVDR